MDICKDYLAGYCQHCLIEYAWESLENKCLRYISAYLVENVLLQQQTLTFAPNKAVWAFEGWLLKMKKITKSKHLIILSGICIRLQNKLFLHH